MFSSLLTTDKRILTPFFSKIFNDSFLEKEKRKERPFTQSFTHSLTQSTNQLSQLSQLTQKKNNVITLYDPFTFMKRKVPLYLLHSNATITTSSSGNPGIDPKFIALCVLGLGISIGCFSKCRFLKL
jgi:hypothetical protein